MARQFSTAVRNAALDAMEVAIGASPTLELRSGPPPATCAAADIGTLLAAMPLPADWLLAAEDGVKSKNGTWAEDAALAAGTVGHFRVKQGATCHDQGTVTITGGGGDMTIDNPVLAPGQLVTVTGYSLTAGGA